MSEQSFRIDWLGGNCPVQAEGEIDGKPFYFRARGERWSMSIGGNDVVGEPEWYYEEPYGDEDFAAGWMTEDEARAFIDRSIALFRRRPDDPTVSPEGGDSVAAARSSSLPSRSSSLEGEGCREDLGIGQREADNGRS
ncbi:hypothetical protein [Antarcticirhabdus aurantiaca]|uniref:Uncharacterized protein n=1 Tax=Antarcticirhabdus aurantiaca TaxID=2606717 RepID=A0ACD4NK44_9HYPH|nr:hypothetical protein [Antarcticirhabdus aurantiaca]WAJ27116.1 hypothetical protein OXU80_20000 [Jeongeuplla avenae]